jgi:hypothetical protein
MFLVSRLSVSGSIQGATHQRNRGIRMSTIRANEVVQDIRTGHADIDLMRKYRLSTKGLEKLINENLIEHDKLLEHSHTYRLVVDRTRGRMHQRISVEFPLNIYDVSSASMGLIRDISESGFRVAGLDSFKGDLKTFQLPVDVLVNSDPLLFIARCVRVRQLGKAMKYEDADFEITEIRKDDQESLKDFVRLLQLNRSVQ